MIEGSECQCDIRSLNNLAALCWSGTKERDAEWVPCREVPCLALPCLAAVTSIYHLNAATLI
jgi:hypothetical protein